MKALIIGAAASLLAATGLGHAAISGSVPGPDDSFSIGFSFANDMAQDILSLSIDGSAVPGTLVWDTVGTPGGSADAPAVAGEDTSVMSFSWGAGGFTTGETFTLSGVDPDFLGSASVMVGEMVGTLVTVVFADQSVFGGVFVDDPAQGAGLMLVAADAAIPVPGAIVLMGSALAGLGLRRRKAA